jgi:hypothetical protein
MNLQLSNPEAPLNERKWEIFIGGSELSDETARRGYDDVADDLRELAEALKQWPAIHQLLSSVAEKLEK